MNCAVFARRCALLLCTTMVCLLLGGCGGKEEQQPPNILLIVLDDLGFNDLGANGNDAAPTPHLNALAQQGMRYTRHYVDASCSVARAALLTGNYPAKYGFRPTHLGLSRGTPTIASVLRDAGYTTQHIGKWHVGNATLAQSPSTLGFDHWFGFLLQQELAGASEDNIHFKSPRYRDPWLREDDSAPVQYTGHFTDIITERAVEFIRRGAFAGQPWFLNLWNFAPHAPIQPDKRFASRHPATPEGRFQALLEQLDDSVGRVLAALEDSGQAQDTLVVVVSDNGGTNRFADNNYPFHGKKTLFFEGGVRTPLLIRWPGQFTPGVSDEIVSVFDILPTLAAAAAVESPPQAIGRDLLRGASAASPRLFWEYTNSEHFTLSALSSDGRWRYTRGSWLGATLNDLEADPSGASNVIAQHPGVVAQLQQEYRAWRLQQRIVDVEYSVLNERGSAMLSGSDLLRSPGYRGFTLALGVTPAAKSAQEETLLQQAGRWSITTEGDALRVAVLGEVIALPRLPADTCSELVVSTHYAFSPIHPDTNWSVIEVFVNGELAASRRNESPVPMYEHYGEPTYLGQDSAGGKPFGGTLSQPLLLNERVLLRESGELLGDHVAGLPALCAEE